MKLKFKIKKKKIQEEKILSLDEAQKILKSKQNRKKMSITVDS